MVSRVRDPSGRYEHSWEELGRGAFKVVYRAFDAEDALEVAWNSMDVERLSEVEREKVENEVDLLSKLRHPNIINLFASWKVMDEERQRLRRLEFITELMVSGTLREYITRAKSIKLKVIRRWSLNILSAIAYLHEREQPIIHRDLKCSNIFVNGNTGEVKLGDLGLACERRGENAHHTVIGTPEFMSPELFDEEYTEKADVYAFGMVLLEMLTGEYPYRECNSSAQIFRKVYRREPPADLVSLRDCDFKRMILRCISSEESRPSALQLTQHPLFADWSNDPGMLYNTDIAGDGPLPPEVKKYLFVEGKIHQTTGEGRSEVLGTVEVSIQIPLGDQRKRVAFAMDPNHDTPEEIAEEMVAALSLDSSVVMELTDQIKSQVEAARTEGRPLALSPSNVEDKTMVREAQVDALRSPAGSTITSCQSSPAPNMADNRGKTVPGFATSSVVVDGRPKSSSAGMDAKRGSSDPEHDPALFALSMSLLEASSRGKVQTVRARLMGGADPNYADYDRRTPLHLAVEEKHAEVVDVLLQFKADFRSEDRWGATPLACLRKSNCPDLEAVFAKHGISIDDDEEPFPVSHLLGMELLQFAANGQLQLAEQRINNGASPNFADYDQRTPLHLASSEGNVDMIRLLLSHGALPDAKDRFGRTPLDDAITHGSEEAIALLRPLT